MTKKTRTPKSSPVVAEAAPYGAILGDVTGLLEEARRTGARVVNSVMTAAYWEIGRRIVEYEQGGESKAEYGKSLLIRLSVDLKARFGRGFGVDHLEQMRRFYLAYRPLPISETLSRKLVGGEISEPPSGEFVAEGVLPIGQTLSAQSEINGSVQIVQTPSAKSDSTEIVQTPSGQSSLAAVAARFPLPWSHYVRLMAVDKPEARKFYEEEARPHRSEEYRAMNSDKDSIERRPDFV